MKTNHLFSQGWAEVTGGERNEIVFERLNKTYGAYEIRTNYDRVLVKSFFGTISFIVLLCSYTLLSGYFRAIEKVVPPYTGILPPITFPPDNPPIDPPPFIDPPKPPVTNTNDLIPQVIDSAIPIDSIPAEYHEPNTTASHGTPCDTCDNDFQLLPNLGRGGLLLGEDTTTHDIWALQEPARFPGGDEELARYLRSSLRIPETVIELGRVREKVGVAFVVEKDGSITGASLLQGGCKLAELNREALRIINRMPKWEPGRQNGIAVKVRMILPIRFEVKN